MRKDPRRRTGRTTRMLEAAIESKAARVWVVTAHHNQAKQLFKQTIALKKLEVTHQDDHYYLRFENIRFIVAQHPEWSWRLMRPTGSSLEDAVFVDHYAIESAFPTENQMARIFAEMHKYDSPTEAQ